MGTAASEIERDLVEGSESVLSGSAAEDCFSLLLSSYLAGITILAEIQVDANETRAARRTH